MAVKRTLRRVGRPPAGARVGEKVKDYPQLALRIPAEAKATLQALSVVNSRPQWRLLSDAIDCYLRGRPAAEKRQVRQLLARSGRKSSSAHRSRRSH